MKIELEIDEIELIELSENYCQQLKTGGMIFSAVTDLSLICKLYQTGLVESGLIENEDGFWTVGRRDGEHVLLEYKPFD